MYHLPSPPPKPFSHTFMPAIIKLSKHVPFPVQRAILEKTLQRAFIDLLSNGDLDFLHGIYAKVHIKDLGLHWYIGSVNRTMTVRKHAPGHVTISGNSRDFFLLITRQEDPDTLFFQRRLLLEGDIETGLHIKNLLDTLDIDALPFPLKHGIHLIGKMLEVEAD